MRPVPEHVECTDFEDIAGSHEWIADATRAEVWEDLVMEVAELEETITALDRSGRSETTMQLSFLQQQLRTRKKLLKRIDVG